MIKSWRHKGVEQFFKTGSKAGINADHTRKLGRMLAVLDSLESPEGMDVAGWGFHSLHGNLAGHWAVKVSGNWRLTFTFEGSDAVLVDYQDYH